MGWTKEQEQAINSTGKNIIVSAGAGSGKTAVLTARTMRILNEGTHINELLILTREEEELNSKRLMFKERSKYQADDIKVHENINNLKVVASAKNLNAIEFYKKQGFKNFDITLTMNMEE